MTKLQISLLSFAIVVSLFALFKPEAVPFSSVSSGSEYLSTTTRTAISGAALTSLTNLCPDGGGTLGSVVLTGANTGIVNFYNGTTTSNHSLYATTTLATIPASAAAGTYVFDINAPLGLIYELQAGLAPTTTITYKCN